MPRKNSDKPFKDEVCRLIIVEHQEIAPTARGLGDGEQILQYWCVKRGWKGPQHQGLPDALSDRLCQPEAFDASLN